jgi:ATP-dependent DNA ligase
MEGMPLPHIDLVRPLSGKESYGDKEWSFEFKYDGFRGVLYIENGRSQFVSRQNKVLHQFDELAEAIALKLAPKLENGILDGELVIKDETQRPVFSTFFIVEGLPCM